MIKQILIFTFLQITSFTSVSAHFNFQHVDCVVPARSIIQIIGDFFAEQQKPFEAELVYFLLQNQNYLKVLNHLPPNQNLKDSCRKNSYIFSKYIGHSVTRISFIFLSQLEPEAGKKDFNHFRERLNYCGEDPTYIFLVISITNNKTFRISPKAASTSKLFVVHSRSNGNNYLQIYVVCLPCRFSHLLELRPSAIDLPKLLDYSWERHNADLQGLRAGTGGARKFHPGKETCSAIKRGGKEFSWNVICAQLVLGSKFNFTDVTVYGQRNTIPFHPYKYDYSFEIEYTAIVGGPEIECWFLYPVSAKYTWLQYSGEKYQFKMASVSYSKPNFEGLIAMVMALDQYTWTASGVSFTLVAILLTLGALKDCVSVTHRKAMAYFTQIWQWILASLSGQCHGTPGILRLTPHLSLFVVTCVLSFFLLGSVFYQSSLYSKLVAVTPPRLPSTFESVLASKIQIITTTRIYHGSATPKSLLKFSLLKPIIKTSLKPKLIGTETLLQDRVHFVRSTSDFIVGVNISEEWDVNLQGNSFQRVMDTSAIINSEYDLDEMLAGVETKRVSYIVRHTEPTKFFIHKPIFITRGFMNSFLSKSIGHLVQSGLYKLWEYLDYTRKFMKDIKGQTSTELYRKVFVKKFFGVKK
ncbi:hypothetical protein Fcan01_22726 [Folsomia candida]|uniref:Uncharacterized protein n=1 Tax=Folsomia candida TaxID=158441 RepID=A0A226D9J8_FOLCA|nr:hypothetical protein Fcan01_22726 [Folsomia candida]